MKIQLISNRKDLERDPDNKDIVDVFVASETDVLSIIANIDENGPYVNIILRDKTNKDLRHVYIYIDNEGNPRFDTYAS